MEMYVTKLELIKSSRLTKDNKIPFYVALPSSTIDWTLNNGLLEIPIEERDHDEVCFVQGLDDKDNLLKVEIAPKNIKARNPAFDVTPAKLVTGLITEKGVFNPNKDDLLKLKKML